MSWIPEITTDPFFSDFISCIVESMAFLNLSEMDKLESILILLQKSELKNANFIDYGALVFKRSVFEKQIKNKFGKNKKLIH